MDIPDGISHLNIPSGYGLWICKLQWCSDTTTTTNASRSNVIDLMADSDAHPFANLMLVSMIIIGFCVFVGWYSKKNQESMENRSGQNGDDGGYLWGLNKSSPSTDSQDTLGVTGSSHRGRHRHKKRLFEEEDLEQRMTVQMTNNDLLAITPDHIGRLQTRPQLPPHEMAPAVPGLGSKPANAPKVRTRRRGKGGAFCQLQDREDSHDVDRYDESEDSEDGVDMIAMRDQYYASQTFSKKLADTLGDITETVSATAQAVKTKLSKREQTVVRPMRMGPMPNKRSSNKKEENKQRFAIVQDEETSDQFDLASSSTESTAEDEYREDPVTAVRTNANGVRIKQPMALPTFDDDDDDEEESESEEDRERRKKKKKKKKRKRERERKRKRRDEVEVKVVQSVEAVEDGMECQDIDIRMNNGENMGFGSDELEDDGHELTKEEVTMTIGDLEMELGKHSQEMQAVAQTQIDDGDGGGGGGMAGSNVDLSFLDNVGGDVDMNVVGMDKNELMGNSDMDISNGNGVVGNGNVVDED